MSIEPIKSLKVLLTPMNLEEEHGRDVDALEDDELHRVDGGHGEGRRLLVGVVQLVEVLVHPGPVEDAVAPVSQIILKEAEGMRYNADMIFSPAFSGNTFLSSTTRRKVPLVDCPL